MKTFKKWNKKPMEDWHSVMSDDAKSFYRAFKNYIKRSFPDAELIGFKPNHYDFSGFIKVNNRYVYVSHQIDRSKMCVDFNQNDFRFGVLYRTAKNDKDYHGGRNQFTSINDFETNIRKLITNDNEWRYTS